MSALLFIVVLVVLVLVHECGHFIAARKTGMRVDEFGIGFPPRLFSWRRGETLYTFNLIPLGGFVKIYGEDNEEGTDAVDPRAFSKRPFYAQALVLVAGVSANILLAFFLFTVVFMIGIDRSVPETEATPDARLTVLSVLPGSPAEEAGIAPGAQIMSARIPEGREVPVEPSAITKAIAQNGEIEITLLSGKETATKTILATRDIEGYGGADPVIGITMGLLERTALPFHEALYRAGEETVRGLTSIAVGIVSLLYDAALFRADLSGVAGPVGIAGLVGDAAAFGITSLLMFTAFISLNLAVINLLPFPALDGGRLVFAIIEAIKGSPLPRRVAYGANAIGFLLLMLLMAAVTYNDIARLVN